MAAMHACTAAAAQQCSEMVMLLQYTKLAVVQRAAAANESAASAASMMAPTRLVDFARVLWLRQNNIGWQDRFGTRHASGAFTFAALTSAF